MRHAWGVMRARFGYRTFRPGQEAALRSALAGRSLLVVMPTGSGKSLIYQLAAVLEEGFTLVVSPLIALMKDQVDELRRKGIAAAYVNSSLTVEEQRRRLVQCTAGEVDLLYVAPERFRSSAFLDMLGHVKPARLAVDEAHCISEWGHDFRPDYRRLKDFRAEMGRPPIIALTATATPRVQADIIESLGLTSDEVDLHVHGFDRPNLSMRVMYAPNRAEKDAFVGEFLRDEQGAGIVYTGTRRAAEDMASQIARIEPRTVVYHAGLDPDARTRAQEEFLRGRARVAVATVAFGMGIDKADIRFVIHYNYPGSVEQYYQEVGRAGRDGKPSRCVLLYAPADRHLREFFIDLSYPEPELVRGVYRTLWRINENPVQMTHEEIAELCEEDLKAGQVGAAIRLLAEAGVVRSAEGDPIVTVGLRSPGAEVLPGIKGAHQRRVFEAMATAADLEKPGWYRIKLGALVSAADLAHEQVRRALTALARAGHIQYTPFRGHGIEKLIADPPPFHELDIDWKRRQYLRGLEEEKLDNMEAYIHTRRCRREFITRYFGESEKPDCDNCDLCMNRAKPGRGGDAGGRALQGRPDIGIAVLRCVRELRFPVGVTKVAQVVTGSRDKSLLKWRFDSNPYYGSVTAKQQAVKEVIEGLVREGYLREEGDFERPVLGLTRRGAQAAESGAIAAAPHALPEEPVRPKKTRAVKQAPAGKVLPATEEAVQMAALRCVAGLERPLGLGKVAAILTGSASMAVRKAGGHDLDVYGTISGSQKEVKGVLRGLVKKGVLSYGGSSRYPTLELTDTGRRLVEAGRSGAAPKRRSDAEMSASANCKDNAPSGAAGRGGASSTLDALLDWVLRSERDRARAYLSELRLFNGSEIARRLETLMDERRLPRERARAVWLLGELCGAEALPLLTGRASSDDERLRSLAVAAIRKILRRFEAKRGKWSSVIAAARNAVERTGSLP